MELFFVALASIGTIATAIFMYPNFAASRPLLRSTVSDVPNADRRGSDGERLQKDGWFILNIQIKSPKTMTTYPRSLSVSKAELGEKIELPEFIEADQSHVERVLIRPQNPEEGELTVRLRYGCFRSVATKCRYRRTHYFGE